MKAAASNSLLSEAAAGISQQFHTHLRVMAEALSGRLDRIDSKYNKRLAELGYERAQRECLAQITPGAAARVVLANQPLPTFLEQVQYRGRRLAKLGATPALVVAALREYDDILAEAIDGRLAGQTTNLEWVRNQLHFLATLALNNEFYQVREAESQAFYELFQAEVEARTLDDVLPRFLSVLVRFTRADAGSIYLADPNTGEWRLRVLSRGVADGERLNPSNRVLQALSTPRIPGAGARDRELILRESWRDLYPSVWSVPLLADGKLRGVFQFGFTKQYSWLPRELQLLLAAAERCWEAAEKAQLLDDLAARNEQVRRLAEHMIEVEEAERRRISRELHDEAGQSLLCIRLQLEMLESELPPELAAVSGRLSEVREMTEHTIVEIRRLIAALSPAILQQMGLAAAIRQLAGRFRRLHPASVRLRLPRRMTMPKRVEIIVYRLFQEIFNNIAKYSLASDVNLSIESADGWLRMHVEDNGVGFQVEDAFARRGCYGLSGLRERVALLGGKLAVMSRTEQDTGLVGSGNEPQRVQRGNHRKAKHGRAGATSSATGQIGVDRRGTAIWIELPLKERGENEPPAGRQAEVRRKRRSGALKAR